MAAILLALCGCRTLEFYTQALQGQLEILHRQQPIEALLSNAETPETLKEKLEIVQLARGFAEKRLGLPVDGHYRKYADLKRPFVVWNVEAAPRFSMEPKGWWYPFVGRLEYRGYFREKNAREYAEALRRKGYDVHVSGASAYSTLGWFKDPVLNTFLFDSDTDVLETLFHELAHQRLFVAGDKDFNEAFATLVAREGVRRWLRTLHRNDEYERFLARTRREDDFAGLVLTARRQLEALYGDQRDQDGRIRASRRNAEAATAGLLAGKEKVFAELREQYALLKARWNQPGEYEDWFSQPINNAKLNSVAAYHELVPGFQKLLDLHDGNLPEFYEEVERLTRLAREERHARIRALQDN